MLVTLDVLMVIFKYIKYYDANRCILDILFSEIYLLLLYFIKHFYTSLFELINDKL
jgi:hypothetical protein